MKKPAMHQFGLATAQSLDPASDSSQASPALPRTRSVESGSSPLISGWLLFCSVGAASAFFFVIFFFLSGQLGEKKKAENADFRPAAQTPKEDSSGGNPAPPNRVQRSESFPAAAKQQSAGTNSQPGERQLADVAIPSGPQERTTQGSSLQATTPSTSAGKEFESKRGKYKVRFPAGQRQDQKTTQDTPVGAIEFVINGVETRPGESFLVLFNDFPPGLPFDLDKALDNELFLSMIRAQASAKAGSKITRETRVRVGGKDALELFIEVPGEGSVRAAVFFAGKRQFQLMVTGSKQAVESRAADGFIKSFKLMN